jgi:transcriptional regulator with XRE-family HTH domain
MLIGARSQMQFARRVPISQPTLSRLLAGHVEPDLAMLEQIAGAAKVPPYFFVEYRANFIAQMVRRVLLASPHLGITAMKAFMSASSIS